MRGYGNNIKKYRKLRRFSQVQLGEKVGVTKSFISKLENESTKPNLDMLKKIAEALDINTVDLLDGKNEPPKELTDAGVEWMILGEELEKQGITKEQVKAWAEIVKNYTKIQNS